MKLDELVEADATTFDSREWSLQLHIGPMKGSASATLIDGKMLASGSVWLKFEYTAIGTVTFVGFSCMRSWMQDDGTYTVRTCRTEAWVPASTMKQGDVIGFDLIISPAEWA